MPDRFILAIEQGSSATKAALVDGNGRIVVKRMCPLSETYPAPGWVDQNPLEILNSVKKAVGDCMAGTDPGSVEAVAFANQRESMLLWDRRTGIPISNLISWQDHRTAEECERLRNLGYSTLVHERSGLPLDPMFSALKAKWLLDIHDPDRSRSSAGEVCLGTVDSYLLSRLGDGKHIIEAGNASRTQLLNVRRREWDPELLDLFHIPAPSLPEIVPSTGPFPVMRCVPGRPDGVPILAVLGNSHASLFGHGAFKPGKLKATFGTGSSVMGLVEKTDCLHPGICLSIAWQLEDIALAAEGNIRSSGAALRWVSRLFGITPLEATAEAEKLARAGGYGAVMIPGFTGLGAPWWDNNATGLISGLTLDMRMDSLTLAAVEAIPSQIVDVVEAIVEGGARTDGIYADGVLAVNPFIMQLQADLAAMPVAKSLEPELALLGVAHMAGLQAGWWGWKDLEEMDRPREFYYPMMPVRQREKRRNRWKRGLARARLNPDSED